MDLKYVIQVCFSDGNSFYTHEELDKLIRDRYGFVYGKYVNSRMIRRIGIDSVTRKINGVTVKGFWLDIKPYTMEKIQQIYESNKPAISTSGDLTDMAKKIRFLMRDWHYLPHWVKMDYKSHRENYLKEIVLGHDHKTEWYYNILRDLQTSGLLFNYEGKDIDFVLRPAKDIIKDLISSGVIKNAKTANSDKMHYLLTENGFARINDFVYGKLIVTISPDILPDW